MGKIIKFILMSVLALIAIIGIAVVVFVKTFDLNKYKAQISKVVYEQTGRELALNGHAGIKISLIPTIELNDVTLSNVPWASEKEMLKVKNVDVSFSIMPLLKKEIVIDKIHLIKPQVYLSVNSKGEPNWVFDTKEKSESVQKKNDVTSEEVAKGVMLAGVVAKSFKIEDGVLVYSDEKAKATHKLDINEISLNSEGMDSNINVNIDVVYNDEKITASIEAGSINSLLQNAKNYPLKADVKAYGATAQINGMLSDVLSSVKYDLDVKATNPKGNFGAPYVKLQSKLNGDIQKINMDIVSLDVAGNEIKGTVKADLSGKKPYVKVNLNSQLIDLDKFNQTKKAEVLFSLIPVAHAANFVPATPIDLKALDMLNADINLDVKKVSVNNISFNNLKTNVTINNGKATLNINELNVGGGNITGSVSANKSNDFSVDLTGSGIVIQDFMKELKPESKDIFGVLSGGKTDLTVKMTSKGDDLKSIVEGLNGQFIVIVDESKVQMGTIKYLQGGFISQLLNALKIKTSDKNLEMSCFVVRSDITDGKATFPKGIALKSNHLTLVSDGYVNLKNDKIDLSLKPFNGKISDTNIVQAISSMLKIGGTIQKPSLTIDNSSVIKNVVGVAAMGSAFLGSQLLLDADESPCHTALKGTSYADKFPAPKGIKAVGQNVYQGANQAVSNSVDLVNEATTGVINFLKGKK